MVHALHIILLARERNRRLTKQLDQPEGVRSICFALVHAAKSHELKPVLVTQPCRKGILLHKQATDSMTRSPTEPPWEQFCLAGEFEFKACASRSKSESTLIQQLPVVRACLEFVNHGVTLQRLIGMTSAEGYGGISL